MTVCGLSIVAPMSVLGREDTFDFTSPEWYIPQLRGVAQRLARMVWDHEAGGSNPLTPTRNCHPRIPKLAQSGETMQSAEGGPGSGVSPDSSTSSPKNGESKGVDLRHRRLGAYNQQIGHGMTLPLPFGQEISTALASVK